MCKFLRSVILLVLIAAVMFILNSAALRLLYGIDVSEQLDALTSLVIAGSFPGQAADVSGLGVGRQDKAYRQGKTGSVNGAADMAAESPGGEANGINRMNGTNGDTGIAGEYTGKNRQGAATDGDEYFMTLDEIASLEGMNLQDKLKAVSILSGVDGEVLNGVMRMAGDGITYDEYNELMGSAKEFLNTADMEALEDILNRNRSLYAQGGK